jgi:hypothetical protein
LVGQFSSGGQFGRVQAVYLFSAMNQPLARFQVYVLFLLLLTATTVTAFLSGWPLPLQ